MSAWLPRTLSALVVAAVAVALVLVGASPASAHESLRSSSPAEGERLAVAPEVVELVFTDEIMTLDGAAMGAVVVVVDESGRDWVTGELQVDGATVVATLEPGMPEAGYQVRWQVVSGDGHPISSVIPFTIGDAEPYRNPDAAQTEGADAGQTPGDDNGLFGQDSPWRILLIGAGGAAAAAGIFALILFLRRRGAPAPDGGDRSA